MHPAMAPAQAVLGRRQTFGVVHAVGMPQPNRSHFEAMEEMERAAPGTSLRTGWIDRVLGPARHRGRAFQATQMGSNIAALGVPRADTGARDVVGRLVRAGRRVGRRTSAPVGHGAAGAVHGRAGRAARAADRRRSTRSPRRDAAGRRAIRRRTAPSTRTPASGGRSATSRG